MIQMQRDTRIDGFTLVELLVVMAIIATLLSLVAPRYFHSLDRAREATLKADLRGLRDAIDKYYGDTGQYPDRLQMLVDKRYLRDIPVDPITDSAESWIPQGPPNDLPGVYDVRSGAQGIGSNGVEYGKW